MNDERRKILDNVISNLELQMTELEIAKDGEQEAFDNIPEALQEAEKGTQMQEHIDALDTAIDELSGVRGNLVEVRDA